jgi:hypothetical protein
VVGSGIFSVDKLEGSALVRHARSILSEAKHKLDVNEATKKVSAIETKRLKTQGTHSREGQFYF